MRCQNAEACWAEIKKTLQRDLLEEVAVLARENQSPANVSFGTSGWRGIIGADFTVRNVKIVTQAIVNVLKSKDPSLRKALGTESFEEVKRRGIVIGRDNRFMGEEFARAVMSVLQKEGIRLYYAGQTTTPEISASIEVLNAACSINITPSHNPCDYSGLKFNPADGGPAGPEITEPIQSEANRLMVGAPPDALPEPEYEEVDTTSLYLDFIQSRGTIDINKIRRFVKDADIVVAVDHVHGATRKRPERLLEIEPGEKLILHRTEDDYLFGGIAPEPSEQNMKNVVEDLRASQARFRIGAIMDPDGDRIRLCDHRMQIPMNYFGAMAFHFLYTYKGIRGVAVKSVGTSNFVNAIARKLAVEVIETKVGFKNFRPYMLRDSEKRAIVAFEESDGISAYNHTLEKDALFGLLLAIEMVATTGKNLSEYLEELFHEYGRFWPARSGVEVPRAMAGPLLKEKILKLRDKYPPGSILNVGGKNLRVTEIITIDGVKFLLEDGSWFMIRPSGTEPKVRFYIDALQVQQQKELFSLAERLTREAIGQAG